MPSLSSPPVRALATLAASLFVLAGCANEVGSRPGVSATSIGTACQTSADCGFPGAVCVTSLPGGYCTIACPSDGCPGTSACAGFQEQTVCANTCTEDTSCRNGYFCNVPSGGTLGICDAFVGTPDAGDRDAGIDATPADVGVVDDSGTAGEDTGAEDDSGPLDTGTGTDAVDEDAAAPDAGPEDSGVAPDVSEDTGSGGPIPIGAACSGDGECGDGGQCVTWIDGGYCTTGCEDDADCGAGNVCLNSGFGPATCLDGCTTNSDCREGHECMDLRVATVCFPPFGLGL